MATLRVQNFRGVHDVGLDLSAPVTLVLGQNGGGKSSLAGAIQHALLGYCDWTDTAGKGAAALIRHGADSAFLELDGTAAGLLIRTIAPAGSSLSAGGRAGKDGQAHLDQTLPNRDLLAACLSSGWFVELPAKRQQDVLFGLSGGSADAAWFAARLTDPERDALDASLASLQTGATLAEDLYKAAYQLRADANKRVKASDGAVKAFAGTPSEPVDVTALETAITTKRDELSELERQAGAAEADAENAASNKRRLEAAEKAFNSARDGRAQIADPPAALDNAAMSALVEQREEADRAHSSAISEHAAAGASYDLLDEQLAKFEALGTGMCVMGDVVCPMTSEQRKAAGDAAQAKLDTLAEAREAAAQTVEQAAKARGDLSAQIRTAEDNRKRVSDHAGLVDQYDRRVEETKANLDELKALKPKKTAAADLDALRSARANLKFDIAADENALSEARAQAGRLADRANAAADLATLEAHWKMLDGLVAKLAPNGLPAQAMAETIGAVLAAVNGVLGQLAQFTLQAVPGEDFALEVLRAGDLMPTRVAHLSEGERLLVGAAIQVAFARLIGWELVVVDAADRLDGKNRARLITMLLQAGDVHALVLATPANGARPSKPGLRVYELEDGVLAVAEVAA